jgi:hypothetical protein
MDLPEDLALGADNTGSDDPDDNGAVPLIVFLGNLPQITVQPTDQTVNQGDTATFSITATGPGPLFYQWQQAQNPSPGGYWLPVDDYFWSEGGDADTLVLPLVCFYNSIQFRCVVWNSYGYVVSDPVLLNVNYNPDTNLPLWPGSADQQQITSYVAPGLTGASSPQITWSGNITGGVFPPGTTYGWNISTDGGSTWTPLTDGAKYTFIDIAPPTGYYIALQVNSLGSGDDGDLFQGTANDGTVWVTSPAELRVSDPAVSVNAPSYPGPTSVIWSVVATGNSALSYQWQVSVDHGTTWTDIASETADTLEIDGVGPADNQNQYRCNVTDGAGTVPSSAMLLDLSTFP